MDIVDTTEEAAELERAPLLVREPLAAFLDSHGLGSGEIRAERVGDGHSNITYLVEREGARFVLRRPPRPPLPPSAHDVLREARLLTALENTPARTPKVLATGDDESILGVPFYVMEEKQGTVLTQNVPPELNDPPVLARIGEQLVDALVEIHAVDWRAAGLEGFGKPTGYLERQLRRFNGLWEHNKTRELPIVQEVGKWLADNMPESPPATIVHGDYRLGNTMVESGPPGELIAIFDWELATIGDPLADVAYMSITWFQPGDDDETMFSALSAVSAHEGFPTRDELIAMYEEKSGRPMGALNWYQALAIWKGAVFMEGNYKRFLAGSSDDDFLAAFDRGVPLLAEKAREIALGG